MSISALPKNVTHLSTSKHKTCVASPFEIKKIVNELKSKQPIAILLFSNIDGKGERIHVFIEDPAGRMQTRRRFLAQPVAGALKYMIGEPIACAFGLSSKTTVIVQVT